MGEILAELDADLRRQEAEIRARCARLTELLRPDKLGADDIVAVAHRLCQRTLAPSSHRLWC